MNTVVTSKEDILTASRDLILTQGWSALSIRSVANACGVSVGSIYNYFHSKSELMGATTERVWCEIFHRPQDPTVFDDTQSCITWIYERMEYGFQQYPSFFTFHSLGFLGEEQPNGTRLMYQTWSHIRDSLCAVLQRDPKVRPNAFDAAFSSQQFADLLFSLMLAALVRQDYDPSVVLELVRRTLY